MTDASSDLREISHSSPLVSIVIPCYKQAHYLPDAIKSALAQTHRPIEVIVVDDGSPDNVVDVVASYPHVRCVRQENRGRAPARNAGFCASAGEYVVFLDADDRLSPNAIEAHLRCFSMHPEAGFVVGDIDQIAGDGSYIYSPRWPPLEANFYEELLKVNHVANTIGVMFRRSVFDALGGFARAFEPAEDYEILLRAARTCQSAHHSTVVAQYRRHIENTSRKGALMLQATHRVMEMQLPILNGNPCLIAAWHQGERYWRDRFGPTTIKQVCTHLRRCEIRAATSAAVALLRYVRGRLFAFPWIYRQQGLDYVRRRLRKPQKPKECSASTIVGR
jgi:glycosyltransferase involved in cell wall biosynthesis